MTNSDFHRSAATEHEPILKKLRFTRDVMKRARMDGKSCLMSIWEQDLEGVEEAIKILSSDGEPSNGKQPLMASRPAPPVPSDPVEMLWKLIRFYDAIDRDHAEGEAKLLDQAAAVVAAAQPPNDAQPAPDSVREALETLASYELVAVGFNGAFTKSDLKDCTWVCGFSGPQPEFRHFEAARAALAAQPPAAPVETKTVYVKRWRTLVNLPAKYADEIVEALRPHNGSSAGNVGATASERNAWADDLQGMIDREEIPDNEMHKATTVLNLLRVTVEPQQFEVTDEMVLEGAKAMVRAGQERRAKGQDLPTRLQESRACLDAALSLSRPEHS